VRSTAGLAAVLASLCLAPGLSAAAPALRLGIRGPAPLYAGDTEQLVVHASSGPVRADAAHVGARARPVALVRVSAHEWHGTARLASPGRWRIRAFAGTAKVQLPLTVLPLVTPSPAGFGPLGGQACGPASPRHRSGDAVAAAEVFGTTMRGQFWGLFMFFPRPDTWASSSVAAVQGIVGKTVKMVFRLNGTGDLTFYSVAPDGRTVDPVSGPDFHTGSNWSRPGVEWGALLRFDQQGCWRIHAAMGRTSGDIWLEVES
jgi:hypothetical protein